MRQSQRVFLRIPIEIKGKGEDGKSFSEQAFTLVINRHGAQISLKKPLRPGDRITIKNLRNRISCPFRVVERVRNPLGQDPEWGVECLEPGVDFWGISFPERGAAQAVPELIDALLECSQCNFRELAQLTMEHYRTLISQSSLSRDCMKCKLRTDWKFGFVDTELEEAGPGEGAETASASLPKRRTKRLMVKIPLHIRLRDGREEVTSTENLSKSGVCFISTLGMKEAERVQIALGQGVGSGQKEMEAIVVWRRPAEGTNKAIYGLEVEESD